MTPPPPPAQLPLVSTVGPASPRGRQLLEGYDTLPAAERARIERIRPAPTRAAVAVAHLLLRSVLQAAFPAASSWAWRRSDRGKLVLPRDVGVHVSLSHTDELVGVVVARRPVGIDIEPANRDVDVAALGRHVLTAPEQRMLARHADPRRAFLRLWTLKEAYSKAVGLGLALDFATIGIRVDGGREVLQAPRQEACAFSSEQRHGHFVATALRVSADG